MLKRIVSVAFILAVVLVAGAQAENATETPRYFIRGAYQLGNVMQSNGFVKGENATGEPIDRFHAARIEFGWQTDGSSDWHQLYNYPTYGLGLYGADFYAEEELGKPTAFYGFFGWPFKHWSRASLNFDVGFGIADNWVSFDPVENPYNVAIGATSSVIIDAGLNYEYRIARRWALIAGGTFTHFSNGGSQKPNYGINQIGALVYVKHMTGNMQPRKPRREIAKYKDSWDLTMLLSGGKRNAPIKPQDYGFDPGWINRDHFIGNLIVQLNRQINHVSRFGLGLDFTYDESITDLIALDGLKNGHNETASFGDKFVFGIQGGYELVVNKVTASAYLGYDLIRTEVEGRLPRLYQRAGAKYRIARNVTLGLNVRFHDFGNADNLEINIGRKFNL